MNRAALRQKPCSRARRGFAAARAFALVTCGVPLAAAQAMAPGPDPFGTVELRVQSANAVFGAGRITGEPLPGIAYAPASETTHVHLAAGAGVFVSSAFELGADAAYTLVRGSPHGRRIAFAPFVRFVTGMPERELGGFVELSPGLLLSNASAQPEATFLQLAAWGGVHFPIGDDAAVLAGPSVASLVALRGPAEDELAFTMRYGLSVYLPASPAPQADETIEQEPSFGSRGLYALELRLHGGGNVGVGARLPRPQASMDGYSTSSERLRTDVVCGIAGFLTPSVALGVDLTGILDRRWDSTRPELNLLGLAPFLKVVSGLEDRSIGWFAEFAPGIAATLVDRDADVWLQLGLWAGGHFPIGDSAALMLGPTLTRLDRITHRAEGEFLFGARYGLGAFLL